MQRCETESEPDGEASVEVLAVWLQQEISERLVAGFASHSVYTRTYIWLVTWSQLLCLRCLVFIGSSFGKCAIL